MEMTDEEALAYLVAKLSTPTGFFLKPGKRGNDLIKRRYKPGGMFGTENFAKKSFPKLIILQFNLQRKRIFLMISMESEVKHLEFLTKSGSLDQTSSLKGGFEIY